MSCIPELSARNGSRGVMPEKKNQIHNSQTYQWNKIFFHIYSTHIREGEGKRECPISLIQLCINQSKGYSIMAYLPFSHGFLPFSHGFLPFSHGFLPESSCHKTGSGCRSPKFTVCKKETYTPSIWKATPTWPSKYIGFYVTAALKSKI